MRDRAIAVLSFLGLLLGLATFYMGLTAAMAPHTCPAQIVGQPSTCPSYSGFLETYVVPALILILSIIGLVYSLRPSKK